MRRFTAQEIHLVAGDEVFVPDIGAVVRITKIDLDKQRVYYRYLDSPRHGEHEWRAGLCVIAGIRNCE